jgi:hypothetical protein
LLTRIRERTAGKHVHFTSLAFVHGALGDKDGALDYIEGACAGHECYVSALNRDCSVDPIRSHPRFRSALSKTGILFPAIGSAA